MRQNRGDEMVFERAIVDEYGEVKHWCNDLSSEEIEEIIELHPEWGVEYVNANNRVRKGV